VSSAGTASEPGHGLKVGVATVSLWLIWGSTYLAILWAMKTLPPFLMAGARFLAAGAVLFLWGKLRGAPWPRAVEWRSTLVIGAFLMLVGNGGVVYAESRLPTGLAALLIATVPLWMVVLEALRPGGKKPNARTLAGVAIGLVGVGILMARGSHTVESAIDPIGVASCLAAALCWSLGSIYSRRAPLPQSPPLTVGMEMLCGGALLMLLGCVHGEVGTLDLAAVSTRSWAALAYLGVMGSLVGFSAYIFLLRETTPAVATTYAYVNPVVAVLLGWAFAGESITGRTIAAMAVIVGAVVLITLPSGPRRGPQTEVEGLDAEAA